MWGEILLERGAGVGRGGCGVAIIMMPDKESIFYALLVKSPLVSGAF